MAFRLAGHHLDRRLGLGDLAAAAGACRLQDTPPGLAAEALAGGPLTKGALSTAVSARLPAGLTPFCVPCQAEHVPESVFRAMGPRGLACFGDRAGRTAVLVGVEDWLGKAPEALDPGAA